MRSFLIAGLVVACCSAALADPLAGPRQDLWNNPACHGHPKDATGEPYSSTMFDLNTNIEHEYASSDFHAMRSHIAAAYAYAKEHCIPLAFGNADRLFDERRHREAFADYRGGFFFPDGSQSITRSYDDAGATDPLNRGIFAASRGRYREAEDALRKSISKAHDFQPAHFMLGNLLYALGRKTEARKEWLAALGSYGNVVPEKEYFGPDPSWLSALRMYGIHT